MNNGFAEILVPLDRYVAGHATGDTAQMRAAFLPTAHVEGLRDNTFVSFDLETYCGLFDGHPAPTEATHTRRIDLVSAAGSVAIASMTLNHGLATFTDMFLLIRTPDGWRIANKVYHRH